MLPHFCIVFNEIIEAEIWHGIKKWAEIEILNFNTEMFKTDEHLTIDRFMSRIDKQIKEYIPLGDDIVFEGKKGKVFRNKPDDDRPEYQYRCRYIASIDTKVYEVTRSNSKLPFVVVIKNFVSGEKLGRKYNDELFFADIYASNDWDSNRVDCKYDFTFLKNLWKKMNLPGEFTMKFVQDRIDECYIDRIPKGEAPRVEPTVYRRDMDMVISSLIKRRDPEILPSIFKK